MDIHFGFVKSDEKIPSGWYMTYQGKLASSKKIAEILNINEDDVIDTLLSYHPSTFMQVTEKGPTAQWFRDIRVKQEYYYYYETKQEAEVAYNALLILTLSQN